MTTSNFDFEKVQLAIHRVEVTDYRYAEQREAKVTPFDCEKQAKFNFDVVALKNAKHLINNWAMSATKIWTRIDLIINDELVESITIKAGV